MAKNNRYYQCNRKGAHKENPLENPNLVCLRKVNELKMDQGKTLVSKKRVNKICELTISLKY